MISVLFVCLGNICRSPTAEAVFRAKAKAAGLMASADSAGTGDWNTGSPPYLPSIFAAQKRGYDLSGLRARQITQEDFTRFDLIIAMDRSNLRDLAALRPETGAQPRLLMSYAPEYDLDIPDPWYSREFEQTLDLIEVGVDHLIKGLRQPPQ